MENLSKFAAIGFAALAFSNLNAMSENRNNYQQLQTSPAEVAEQLRTPESFSQWMDNQFAYKKNQFTYRCLYSQMRHIGRLIANYQMDQRSDNDPDKRFKLANLLMEAYETIARDKPYTIFYKKREKFRFAREVMSEYLKLHPLSSERSNSLSAGQGQKDIWDLCGSLRYSLMIVHPCGPSGHREVTYRKLTKADFESSQLRAFLDTTHIPSEKLLEKIMYKRKTYMQRSIFGLN